MLPPRWLPETHLMWLLVLFLGVGSGLLLLLRMRLNIRARLAGTTILWRWCEGECEGGCFGVPIERWGLIEWRVCFASKANTM